MDLNRLTYCPQERGFSTEVNFMWPTPDDEQPKLQAIEQQAVVATVPSANELHQQASVTGVPPSSANLGGLSTPIAATGINSMNRISIENEKAGPKGAFVVAGVLAGLGVLALVVAGVFGSAVTGVFSDLSVEDYTTQHGDSVNLTHTDIDLAGEEGWYLLIPGDTKADLDGNRIMDACEGVNFTITDANGTDVSDQIARVSCSMETGQDSNAKEDYFDITDHIIVARICHTLEMYDEDTETWTQEHDCEVGETYTITNDAGINMSVVDLDATFLPVLEEAIGLGAGAFISGAVGCCGLCGGLIALIVALMRLSGNKKQTEMQFVMH